MHGISFLFNKSKKKDYRNPDSEGGVSNIEYRPVMSPYLDIYEDKIKNLPEPYPVDKVSYSASEHEGKAKAAVSAFFEEIEDDDYCYY
jgi:hypothetical protein